MVDVMFYFLSSSFTIFLYHWARTGHRNCNDGLRAHGGLYYDHKGGRAS